jgi:hypothetical protein
MGFHDPSFPVDGDFRLPNTKEKRVLDIASLLRKVYQEGLKVTLTA